MSATWGTNIELSIFGESHGEAIGIVIGNLPAGIHLDMDDIFHQMQRRAPGQNLMSSPRQEKDRVHIMSGVLNHVTTGAPLCAMIYNEDHHSQDYSLLRDCMRPGHSDYAAYMKYHGFHDVRGGGHFSGRLTAPIVFAGTIAKQILKQKGIVIGAHIRSIKDIEDDAFDVNVTSQDIETMLKQHYPTLNVSSFSKMTEAIEEARQKQDSLGGTIECAILNVPAGIGRPFFDSIESHLSSLLFSIPAVKSLYFGCQNMTQLYGHEANDAYYYHEQTVKTKTNHNGGILGGISNGMPIVFTVGIKPTPSISQPQQTINVATKENATIKVEGRHDPCIVPRAVVVVESMAALGLLDMMVCL